MAIAKQNVPINTKGLKTNYTTGKKTPICIESHPMGYRKVERGKGTHNPDMKLKTRGR